MIFLAGTNYKIIEDEILVMTSCITARSAFTIAERYTQTLESIYSVRKYLPNVKIVMIEMGKCPIRYNNGIIKVELLEEWKQNLNSLCDYFIDCSSNSDIQNLNEIKDDLYWHAIKCIGECALMIEVLSHIQAKVVYKLSGRYKLGKSINNFDLSKINVRFHENNVLIPFEGDLNWKYRYLDNSIYQTTFFSIPGIDINYMVEVYKMSLKRLLLLHEAKAVYSIEQCLYNFIDKQKVHFVSTLGCTGYLAQSKETLYEA